MPQQQSPFLEGKYGWNFGEGGWNTGMDENLLKFSYMFDRNVDGIVSSLPAAVNGQAYFLTTDNRLHFAVGNTWYSSPVPKWFEFKIRNTGDVYQFNGTTAVQIESPAGLDSRLDAVELTVSTLGSAAFEDVSAFATQAALDVVGAQAQSYTDALRLELAGDPVGGEGAMLVRGSVVQIASIAALRTLEPAFDGQQVELLGHTVAGLGGGVFYADYSSSAADDNGGVVVTSGGRRWRRRVDGVLTPQMFGALGDGVTDDTQAFQAAINYFTLPLNPRRTRGLSVRVPGGFQYFLNGSITVRSGVTLKGDGDKVPDYYSGFNYTLASKLYLSGSATLTLQEGSGLDSLYIIRQGVSDAETAADVSTWTGTAVSAALPGASVNKCCILGFNLAVDAYASRFRMRECLIDCKNGVRHSNSHDIGYISEVHCWPYLSKNTQDSANYQRPGFGFKLEGVIDWEKLTNCFTYGYYNGFHIVDARSATLIGCSADNVPGQSSSSTGFRIEGNAGNISLQECQSAASGRGIYINTTISQGQVRPIIQISNHRAWYHDGRAVLINSDAHVSIRGGIITNCPYGVSIGSLDASGMINDVTFDHIATEAIQYSVSNKNFIRKNNMLIGATGVMETPGAGPISIPSASSLPYSPAYPIATVTGSTTITKIESRLAAVGDEFILRFAGSPTLVDTASGEGLNLIGSGDITVVPGGSCRFVYTGGGSWVEVSRTFNA